MHLPSKPRGRSLAPIFVVLATLAMGLLGPATAGAIRNASYTQAHQVRLEERLARKAQRQSAREQRRSEREAAHSGASETPPISTASATCGVTITSSSARVLAGESVALSGTVTCPGQTATSDAQIEIYEHLASSGRNVASLVHTLTAAADGSFATTSPPLTANTVFLATVGSVRARTAVKVAPVVTLNASPAPESVAAVGATARTRRTETLFSGTVAPAVPGALVALQVSSATGGRWRTIGWTHTDVEGAYSIDRVLRSPSVTSVRTLVHPGSHLSPGVSGPLSLQGFQPQRSGLTIYTSGDPVVEGQAVQISGVVADGADVAVKLLGRTASGRWTVLGETTTNEAGGYSFEQDPPETTLFRVTDATGRSKALNQRVAFAISPEAEPSTAAAGEVLTFHVTVANAPVGTPVILEALGATGLNFHPVATGAVDLSQQASVAHAFPAGDYTLRLRLPGNGAHSSAASSSFVLTVTP